YSPGAARTERSTRTEAGVNPSAVRVTVAECVPGASPSGSAASSRVRGVVPRAGPAVSHGASDLAVTSALPGAEVTSTVRVRGGPSTSLTSWSTAGAAVSAGRTVPVVNV